MRSILSGFAVAAVLAGMVVPSFASQETLTSAMGVLAQCQTTVECQDAWAAFQAELPTAGLTAAQIDRLQVSALNRVTGNLGDATQLQAFLATPSVATFVTSSGFATASGEVATSSCNFSDASSSGFCS